MSDWKQQLSMSMLLFISIGGAQAAYVAGNPLSNIDPRGLATQQEIRQAVATLRCANAGEFRKLANSIAMVDLGEKGVGKTDWSNNIELNSRLYGDDNTPVDRFVQDRFLQTLAHEMLHVNEGPAQFATSTIRMGSPFGYFHQQLDGRAEAMITNQLLGQFQKALSDGDAGCTCAR